MRAQVRMQFRFAIQQVVGRIHPLALLAIV
jgi:hypothetical protein